MNIFKSFFKNLSNDRALRISDFSSLDFEIKENKLRIKFPEQKLPEDTCCSMRKVTRVEVIDTKGRSYVNTGCETVELSMQDDNRTLKIFIKK